MQTLTENELLKLPIEKLKESKDFAASNQDAEAFILLRRVIMVKEVIKNEH